MGITTFHAGTTMNIIDDVAEIGGTFRFFNMAEGRKVHALFRQVAEHHNEKFDLSETVLRTGVISTVRYAVEWLQ